MAEEGFQEAQHGDTPSESVPTDLRPRQARVVCPLCHRATDSLKVYDKSVANRRPQIVASCPPCMRRSILRRALLLFPWSFVFMPFFAWILLTEYRESWEKGHSDLTIAEAHRMSREEQFEAAVRRMTQRAKQRREWFLFGLIVVLIAGFWAAVLAWLH